MTDVKMSAFSRGLAPEAAVIPPPVANKNWNPGNYIAETAYDSDSLFNQIRTRLQNDTAGNYKGVLLRYPWTMLETAQGVYGGFDTIEARLAQIAALSGRRAIVFIQIKTFSGGDAVPAYMRNSATYADGKDYYVTRNGTRTQGSRNGQYNYEAGTFGGFGCIPNMHVTAVRDRLIALFQAFGTRFNDNPNLEAVVINEAAILEPAGSVGAASETINAGTPQQQVITRPNTDGGAWVDNDLWFTNMVTTWGAARAALSNIQCCQWINADRSSMQDANDQGFVPDITALGVGLGMPDGAADERGFNFNPTDNPTAGRGNIYLCQQHNGDAIIMVHASKPALEGSVITTTQTVANASPGQYAYPGIAWTRQQMSTWAKNTVGATHVCWAHNTGTHQVNATYMGQNYNTVTDNHIANGSDITTVTTRPTGW